MVNEEFLQFIWGRRLFDHHNLKSTCGRSLEILGTGEPNMHAGPDYFNARIRIDGIVWAGNVEIHVCSSDWSRHRHQSDPAFANVILHVVRVCDRDAFNCYGRRIQTLVIRYPPGLEMRYRMLRMSDMWLPCSQFIRHLPASYLRQWLRHLQSERAAGKSARIRNAHIKNERDWQKTLYQALASGYGLPINRVPFEMAIATIPLHLLLEYKHSRTSLEAILYGQSGFPGICGKEGPYVTTLRNRHLALLDHFSGHPVPAHFWKFLRLRPASFPTLRISQFASLVHQHFPLLNRVVSCRSLTELEKILRTNASEYWNTHYLFGRSSPGSAKYLGTQASRTVIINSLVPFYEAYGRMQHSSAHIDFAAGIMEELRAETNDIVKKWTFFGFTPSGAKESQALIQLYNSYCRERRCLECHIGSLFVESAMYEGNGMLVNRKK